MKYRLIGMTKYFLVISLLLTSCSPEIASPTIPLPIVTPTPDNLAEKIDIGGRGLYLLCLGAGSPIVILDAGLGDTSLIWTSVYQEVQTFSRVCAYDRAGLGQSDSGPKPHTSQDIVTDLHTLLVNANLTGPYVLVGHSIGGFNMRVYASQYLEEIAGLILVDSTHPDENTRNLAVLPPESPDEDSGVKAIRQLYTVVWNDSAQNEEGVDIAASATQAREVSSLGNLPLIVLTAGLTQWSPWPGPLPQDVQTKLDEVQQGLQKEFLSLSSNSKQIMATESHHWIPSDQPDVVINAIREMVEALRK